MKYPYFASLVVSILLSTTAAEAQQLVPKIDAPQWSLTLEQKLANKNRSLTSQERELLTQLKPIIEQQQYQQALEQLNQQKQSIDESALLLRLRGQVNLALQHFQNAQDDLKNSLDLEPDNQAALQNLATAYLSESKLEQARPYLVKRLQTGALSAQLYGQLGYINLKTALPMSAVSAYEKAMMLEPENKQWSQGLLYALVKSQSVHRANALVEELLQQQPGNSVLWLQRSQLAIDQERYQEAIASLESALKLQTENSRALLQLASLHAQFGSLNRSVELLQKVDREGLNKQDGASDSRYFSTISQVTQQLLAHEQWPLFEELYNEINQAGFAPEQRAEMLLSKARYQQRRGTNEEAEETLEQLLNIDPNNGNALIQLAKLKYEQANLTQAQLLYQRASALKAVEDQATIGLAQVAIDQKDYRKGLELLRKAYKNNPGRTELLDNIHTLEGLI